jgi:hypothetical protein
VNEVQQVCRLLDGVGALGDNDSVDAGPKLRLDLSGEAEQVREAERGAGQAPEVVRLDVDTEVGKCGLGGEELGRRQSWRDPASRLWSHGNGAAERVDSDAGTAFVAHPGLAPSGWNDLQCAWQSCALGRPGCPA